MDKISAFIKHLRAHPFYKGQVAHTKRIAERRARYGRLQRPLTPALQDALQRAGSDRLYSHQAEAINAARQGYHVVVATGTASGKTLCYNIPVLETWLADWRSRALYIFPTKALAQDQLRALRELTGGLGQIRYGTYDGDTPRPTRTRLRKDAAILLTNPDMLHLGILPNHTLWANFLRSLRYVVVDEMHAYRGVFGSHVASVLRRLRRLCAFYGSSPQFICCSATIANPGEHAARLTGLEPVVVDQDGSPQGAKTFVLWNPPFVDRAQSARRSANFEAAALFAEMAVAGLRNITFTRARRVAELILRYAREQLSEAHPDLVRRVASYRAGYLPEQRREIEQALFHGRLLGVTATSALELGVDVGALDATVSVGYPGSIASLWQQAGRAGRGREESLAVLIGLDDPLDQYFLRHPDDLFGRPHEHALIDPGNVYLLEQHLPCAAHEMPLTSADEELFGPGYVQAMINLEERGILDYRGERWFYMGGRYPAEDVNIRSIGGRPVALLDETNNYRSLEVIEASSAPARAHPGAIYLHQGETYLVTDLNLEGGFANVCPVEVDYYTQPREVNELSIIRSLRSREFKTTCAYWGPVRVTQQVIGYRKVQQFSDTVLDVEYLDLPAQTFETRALWWDVPVEVGRQVSRRGWDFMGGLHAIEHAAIGILPLFAMCDRWDIGGISTTNHPDTGQPQVFIYDGYPGGVGIAEQGFALLEELWRATWKLLRECPCEDGCPSCIQSPRCGSNNEPLDKRAAIFILEMLLRGQTTSGRIDAGRSTASP
jgi:DEAD/DEAH box helicase domain-containing protein